MGCIVNGPGEMADADFGYVGGAPGKVDLYLGKEVDEPARCSIPNDDACDALVELIKEHGMWKDKEEDDEEDELADSEEEVEKVRRDASFVAQKHESRVLHSPTWRR